MLQSASLKETRENHALKRAREPNPIQADDPMNFCETSNSSRRVIDIQIEEKILSSWTKSFGLHSRRHDARMILHMLHLSQ